ncbi:flagellar basal body P-ring biosynthesis protein FlgA [Pseudobythopirellula maris]|uniref:Flagellar basal body P-ring biosynthesis protein FlgA n=1 Tax=Pseudobythopirellula maris TaxID=2527991 RepID=A0A5C5ZLA6_9BACT|nr:flagellar basal body P-ring formation chaperone FlgA [Pseudobythopirellula maris]TWT88224.1 flagellar basal body P-ring biosynthesis protein FlgA [Pseudobythopirellula maris]
MLRFVFLALIAFASGFASAADVLLRESAAPGGTIVRLSDVAQVTNAANDAERAALEALPLMPTPAPGVVQHVRAQAVRELLRAQGFDLAELRFGGAIRVEVAGPGAAPITRDAVAHESAPRSTTPQPAALPTAAAAAPRTAPPSITSFRAAAPAATPRRRPATLTYSERRRVEADLVRATEESLRGATGDELYGVDAVELTDSEAMRLAEATGLASVSLVEPIEPGEQGPKRFGLSAPSAAGPIEFVFTARLVRHTPAVVAVRPIARGELVTASHVRLTALSPEEGARTRGVPHSDVDTVIGREAVQNISESSALTTTNCLPVKMVMRGEVVTVLTTGGGIRVQRLAKAKQDGRHGDVIAVETLDSKDQIEARVVGQRRLAVLGSGAAIGGIAR